MLWLACCYTSSRTPSKLYHRGVFKRNNETKELLDQKNIKNSPTCQQAEALPWVWATEWNQECNRIWTVLHALKYNMSSNTMQRLTRYLKDIDYIFTSGTVGMASTKDPMLFCFSNRNFEPRLFVPMPGNMGRPAFTFINLYIFL
jgi:hypothetical protein